MFIMRVNLYSHSLLTCDLEMLATLNTSYRVRVNTCCMNISDRTQIIGCVNVTQSLVAVSDITSQ